MWKIKGLLLANALGKTARNHEGTGPLCLAMASSREEDRGQNGTFHPCKRDAPQEQLILCMNAVLPSLSHPYTWVDVTYS